MASIIPNFPSEQLARKGPTLLHTVEAWYFSLSAYACGMEGGLTAPQPSIWISGQGAAVDAGVLVCWAEATSTLVLSFDGGLSLLLRSFDLHNSKEKLIMQRPFYLRPSDTSAQGAEIVAEYNTALHGMYPGIKAAIAKLTAGKTPLRVLCTGFCMGGGLAVVLAPWAALQWPQADISCIAFGAPVVGNTAFSKLSAWLVGLPSHKLSIKLCPAGDDLYFDGRNPIQPQRPLLMLHHNFADHSTAAYDQGITAATTGPSVPTTADGRTVLVDPRVAGEVAELALRGDCECVCAQAEALLQSCQPSADLPAAGSGAGARGAPVCDSELCSTSAGVEGTATCNERCKRELETTNEEWKKGSEIHQQQNLKSAAAGERGPEGSSIHQIIKFPPSCAVGSCAPMGRGFLGVFYGLGSCVTCLAAPVINTSTAVTRSRGAAHLRVDQFWSEMHEQAEAMREASNEVARYMNDVMHGKKAQPPPVVTTAMAVAVRLGEQAEGPELRFLPRESSTEPQDEHGSRTDECEDAHEVVMEMPAGIADGDTDRVKRVAAARLALPATAAYAAYLETPEQFSAATKLQNVTSVHDPKTGATVFVAWVPETSTAVLAFRGTASRSDAVADLKFLPRQIEFLPELFPGATAHLGFLTHFTGLISTVDPQRSVHSALSSISGGATPVRVICCGHSMGGALATLGATWAALQYPGAEIRCITFGAPRTGNSRFIKSFRTLVGMRIRVVHGSDPIPSMPPPLRYSHFQPAVFLRRGKLELSQGGWYRTLAVALGDHHMQKYLDSLHIAPARAASRKGEKTGEEKEGIRAAEQREQEAMAAVASRTPLAWFRWAFSGRGV